MSNITRNSSWKVAKAWFLKVIHCSREVVEKRHFVCLKRKWFKGVC